MPRGQYGPPSSVAEPALAARPGDVAERDARCPSALESRWLLFSRAWNGHERSRPGALPACDGRIVACSRLEHGRVSCPGSAAAPALSPSRLRPKGPPRGPRRGQGGVAEKGSRRTWPGVRRVAALARAGATREPHAIAILPIGSGSGVAGVTQGSGSASPWGALPPPQPISPPSPCNPGV